MKKKKKKASSPEERLKRARSNRQRHKRMLRKKYYKYIISDGQRLQKKIIRNYWRFLTYNYNFQSQTETEIQSLLRETVGIVVVPHRRPKVSRSGLIDYPQFREIINDTSVIENSIVETAMVSKIVLVFGDSSTLYRLQKTLGSRLHFSGERNYKNIFYIPNRFLPEDRRAMIWYSFRYVNKCIEQTSDNVYLKYFFHFCYESFDIEKYKKLISASNPVQSIFFEAEGESFITGKPTPVLLSALDIFKIRRMKTWSEQEFTKRAYHPKTLNVDLIHDFSEKAGIVDYIRSGDTYIENRKYRFSQRLRG